MRKNKTKNGTRLDTSTNQKSYKRSNISTIFIVSSIGVLLLYLFPVLSILFKNDFNFSIFSQHQEGLSLTTYGRWFFYPPHHFLTDAFSGEFKVFYNYTSDYLVNLLGMIFCLRPMYAQMVIWAPLLAVGMFASNYLFLKRVINEKPALLASMLISIGGNSQLMHLINESSNDQLTRTLHVPFHAIGLASAQSLGWLLMIPNLVMVFEITKEYNFRKGIVAGILLGLTLHSHTLTFINIIFCIVTFWLALFLCNKKLILKTYLTIFAPALFVALLYVLPFIVELLNLVAQPRIAEAGVTPLNAIVFFLPYLFCFVSLIAKSVHKIYGPKNDLSLIWLTSIFFGTLLLSLNDYWGWNNHPYRFMINLIYPLSIAVGMFLFDQHQSTRFFSNKRGFIKLPVLGWIIFIMLFNIYSFLNGNRPYQNVAAMDPLGIDFLTKFAELTKTKSARDGYSILTPPEFDYPGGVVQTSILLNYSLLPSFIPDYRFILWQERYYNRMALFCFLFPNYPHFDNHTGLQYCASYPSDSQKFELLNYKLKSSVLEMYKIAFAGALGDPFYTSLSQAASLYQWETKSDMGGPAFYKINQPKLEGAAFGEQIKYTKNTVEIQFSVESNKRYDIVTGSRNFDANVKKTEIDGEVVTFSKVDSNWHFSTTNLTAGSHRIKFTINEDRTNLYQFYEMFYFFSAIEDDQFRNYIKM